MEDEGEYSSEDETMMEMGPPAEALMLLGVWYLDVEGHYRIAF